MINMKILYIHQYFHFPEQSGGTRSYDLATSFVKRGIQVEMISASRVNGNKKWDEFERDGIKFYMLNCPYDNKMSFGRRIISFISFMCNASIKALQINCDCVLATSTPLTVAIPALVRKWIKKTPYVFEVRDVWPEVPIKMGIIKNKIAIKFLYWFEKLVYKNASAIVPLSVGMDMDVKSRYPNGKSVVIPNISEISRFASISSAIDLNIPIKGKKIVLYAGTLGIVNGTNYIVDIAYETLKIDSGIHYLIFGDGKEKEKVLKYAGEKGVLNNNLFVLNSVRKNELPYLYSIATVGFSSVIDNPILWENSANKFFDTLAASKPIVINYKGWQADVIRSKNVGYVLPAKVTIEAVKEFVKYISNDKLLLEQGKNALNLAKEEYSLDVAVDKYIEIFSNLKVNHV